jgi:hypothetical protein
VSEYQYYEFVAIDRPLTRKQIDEVRAFSTRAEITSTSFVNEYHFGDFHGNPELLVSKYFDVMLYYANWGMHRLLMNVPVPEKELKLYAHGEVLCISRKNDRVLLDFNSNTEDYEDWDTESNRLMASLAPIRAEIAGGDARPLFLGWLAGVSIDDEESDKLVPSVPDGMGKLTAAQKALADFIRVDDDLLGAAANHSQTALPPALRLSDWVAQLPKDDKDRFIESVVGETDPAAIAQMRRRYQLESRQARVGDSSEQITIGQLVQEAKGVVKEREFADSVRRKRAEARRAAEAAEERERRIRNTMRDESGAWKSVENIVVNKQAAAYDMAVKTLGDLREVAVRRGALDQFAKRIGRMREEHRTKHKFLKSLDSAGLFGI